MIKKKFNSITFFLLSTVLALTTTQVKAQDKETVKLILTELLKHENIKENLVLQDLTHSEFIVLSNNYSLKDFGFKSSKTDSINLLNLYVLITNEANIFYEAYEKNIDIISFKKECDKKVIIDFKLVKRCMYEGKYTGSILLEKIDNIWKVKKIKINKSKNVGKVLKYKGVRLGNG